MTGYDTSPNSGDPKFKFSELRLGRLFIMILKACDFYLMKRYTWILRISVVKHYSIVGIIRRMNASNKGTVKAVSP